MTNIKTPIDVQIAFQGGGAKIFALIAAAEALKKLEIEKRIRVTRISGSSAGSIVGACYAAGLSISEMRKLFSQLPAGFSKYELSNNKLKIAFSLWKQFLKRKKPLYEESLLKEILQKESRFNQRISDLKLPLIVTASDLAKGEQITYTGEKILLDAILDSCRIPFVFGNNNIFHNVYDGGITGNLPVYHLIDEIDEFGYIIAFTFKEEKNEIEGITDLILRTMFSAIESSVSLELKRKRIFPIELDALRVSTLEFEKAIEILDITKVNTNSKYNDVRDKAKKILENYLDNQEFEKEDFLFQFRNLTYNFPKIKTIINDRYTKRLFVNYEYGAINYESPLMDKIQSVLQEKGYAPQPLEGKEYFDAFQRPELALLNEVIYLFPFFLSKMRKSYWGVVQYGHHRAIGLLMKKKNSLNITSKFLNAHTYNKKNLPLAVAKTENIGKQHWIDDIIKAIGRRGGKLISISGYLFNEIIPLMILESKDPAGINFFLEIKQEKTPQELINDYSEQGLNKEKQIYQGLLKEFEKAPTKNAIIFDLTYKEELKDLIKNKDYVIYELFHYLDIPVGIGFTLTTYNEISKFWAEIQQNIMETVKSRKEEFFKHGIQIK